VSDIDTRVSLVGTLRRYQWRKPRHLCTSVPEGRDLKAFAVVRWLFDPHCRLPRKGIVRSTSALSVSSAPPRATAEFWLPFDIAVIDPEDVASISSAMRGDGVGVHIRSIIFGTLPHRSPVFLLELGGTGVGGYALFSVVSKYGGDITA